MDTLDKIRNLSTIGELRIFNDRYLHYEVSLHDDSENLVWRANAPTLEGALDVLNNLLGDHYNGKE